MCSTSLSRRSGRASGDKGHDRPFVRAEHLGADAAHFEGALLATFSIRCILTFTIF